MLSLLVYYIDETCFMLYCIQVFDNKLFWFNTFDSIELCWNFSEANIRKIFSLKNFYSL